MKPSKVLVTLVLLMMCVTAVGVGRFTRAMRTDRPSTGVQASRAKGNPNASLWLVEYIDYQCQSCQDASALLNSYFQEFPDDIYLQVRFFPLTPHPHGLRSAQYSECASRQGHFWSFHELLFEKQEDWSPLASVDSVFHEYASSVGVDLNKLDACLEDNRITDTIMDEKKAAQNIGIDGTPAFFANGKLLVGRKAIEELLEAFFAEKRKLKS